MSSRKLSLSLLCQWHLQRDCCPPANMRPLRSYQEMITHLAMNAHPNPKRVLVIGGGDGGVLREVVKHSTVEQAILCDIDESVIRLSKKYLPGMSIGFQHPNVSVHIGDGFKFLADKKNEFDVIITDSSDPEGPAESLFQKPYFELLFGALREGGVVTTQGCSSFLFLQPSPPHHPHPIPKTPPPLTTKTPLSNSGKPMAPPLTNHRPQKILQRSLPHRRIRLHHHPDLPLRPDRLHGLLQRQGSRRENAVEGMEHRGGGEVVQVLQ